MKIWMVPTITPSSTRASAISVLSSGSRNASALKTTSEIALVGPLIKCDDEPNIEATAVTTIAE